MSELKEGYRPPESPSHFENRAEFEKRVLEVTGKPLEDIEEGYLYDTLSYEQVLTLKNSTESVVILGIDSQPKIDKERNVYVYTEFLVVNLTGLKDGWWEETEKTAET